MKKSPHSCPKQADTKVTSCPHVNQKVQNRPKSFKKFNFLKKVYQNFENSWWGGRGVQTRFWRISNKDCIFFRKLTDTFYSDLYNIPNHQRQKDDILIKCSPNTILHISYVTCHMPYGMCHIKCVRCHMSCVTCNLIWLKVLVSTNLKEIVNKKKSCNLFFFSYIILN